MYYRIGKRKARKCYQNGQPLLIKAVKTRLEHGIVIDPCQNTADFDRVVNAFEYYNCNYECGYYAAFYVEV